jgi:hypothetical protein
LPSGSDLRRRLLPFLSQAFEFASAGRQFGLDLGEVADCSLMLAVLSHKPILGSL